MRRSAVWASLVGSVLVCAAGAVGCWLQTSVVGLLTNLGGLAVLVILAVGFQRPASFLLPAPFRWVHPAIAVAALASVARIGRLGWPHISSTAMGLVVFVCVLLAYVLTGLREPGGADSLTVWLPIGSGRWVVWRGGVSALNHHVGAPERACALDLVRLGGNGARAEGVCPPALGDYRSYGAEVLAPCAGTVTDVVDGVADHPPHAGRFAGHDAGNLVRIDTGDSLVTIARLRPGTVLVAVGDRVARGEVLAAVGSSGHSVEPHLHIHAERAGRPVRLRFRNAPGRRPRPGLTITDPVSGP